jgi:hypothetical protein
MAQFSGWAWKMRIIREKNGLRNFCVSFFLKGGFCCLQSESTANHLLSFNPLTHRIQLDCLSFEAINVTGHNPKNVENRLQYAFLSKDLIIALIHRWHLYKYSVMHFLQGNAQTFSMGGLVCSPAK